jgi:hypothetical protein
MSIKRYILVLPLTLILLVIVACTGRESAPAGLEVASGEVTPLDSGDVVTSTAVAVEASPTSVKTSPTPSPLLATARPTLTPGSEISPSQLEPTATATIAPPTLTPAATPVPTSSVVPGWLTYENRFPGYSFSYPPEATIDHHGTTVEPPEDITSWLEYLAWVKTVYPNDLCVGVGYKTGFVAIHPRDETLAGYASPCGITGIGDYTIEDWEEVVTIKGQPYTASAKRLYIWQTDQLEHEYYILLDVNDNLRIDFGLSMNGAPGSAQQDLSEAEINEVRETLLRIVESFRFQ